MFRNTLLATTALVLGATVAFANHGTAPRHQAPTAQHFVPGHSVHGVAMAVMTNKHSGVVHNNHALPPGGVYNNFSKDANAQFVSWYGFRVENSNVSYYFSAHSWIKEQVTAANAVPFTGSGKAKGMTFAGFGYSANMEFAGQILSSSGGLPGAVVAQTASTTMSDNALCCTSARQVNFPHKVVLSGNYFASVACTNSPCDGGWAMEDTDFTGGTVDYYHDKVNETYNTYYSGGTQHYSFSSPWHASTYYPTAGAVIVK